MGQAGGNEQEAVKKSRKCATAGDTPGKLGTEGDSKPRFEGNRARAASWEDKGTTSRQRCQEIHYWLQHKAQNHGTVWVGRNIKDHLFPTRCHHQGHLALNQVSQASEHSVGSSFHPFSNSHKSHSKSILCLVQLWKSPLLSEAGALLLEDV